MLLALAVVLLTAAPGAASSPGGVSLSRDWVLDVATAQPLSQYFTKVQSDARYCKLTGCTFTGEVTHAADINLNDTKALQFVPATACGANGSTCWYMQASILRLYFAGADRLTFNNATGAISSNGAWSQTGQLDVTGAVTVTTIFQSSRNAAAAVNMAGTGWLESAGDTAANIATRTCTAGSGCLIYDDTTNCWRSNQGGAWSGCLVAQTSPSTITDTPQNLFTGICQAGAACTEDTNFLGPARTVTNDGWDRTNVKTVGCSWATAGTGGTTGVVVQVYDLTAGAEVCNCTLGACTTAANVPMVCTCTATLTNTATTLVLRLKNTTDCTANPQQIVCNVTGATFP